MKKYLGVLIIILMGILGILVYSALRTPQAIPSDISSSSKEDILSKLGRIMILPTDESNPKIAKISNIDQLKAEDSEFYKNAKNGDTLILYNAIAVIYRESENKIVNIAPISKDSSSNSSGN